MKALVSIITVNYNGLRDTCEMIDSFRNHETYPHYEIIVVDNGSRLPEAEEIQAVSYTHLTLPTSDLV